MARPCAVLAALLAVLLLAGSCSKNLVEPTRSPAGSHRAGQALGTRAALDSPFAVIVSPQPSHLIFALVSPNPTITWAPAGPSAPTPSGYRYRLFRADDPEFVVYLSNPDSLRRKYAPDYPGWVSVGPDVRQAHFENLELNQRYLFAVVASNDTGPAQPVFSLDLNVLVFNVTLPEICGGRLRISNESFMAETPTGPWAQPPFWNGWNDPVTLPAGERLSIHWAEIPRPFAQGQILTGYRWAFEKLHAPPTGDSPKLRWSLWSPADTGTVLHPLAPADTSRRYLLRVQAMDTWGCIADLAVFFRVAPRDRGSAAAR